MTTRSESTSRQNHSERRRRWRSDRADGVQTWPSGNTCAIPAGAESPPEERLRPAMPARSNLFQRLVLEVHRELGPGWAVTESRQLKDAVTGEPREVDIVAEAAVGGYPLLLCIEVRDRGRPADVTWLEALAKKHDHLP